MPTVKNFGSYRIMLFAEDHNPPHVHVIGRDFQAKVRIRDAAVFAGTIPSRHAPTLTLPRKRGRDGRGRR